MSATRKLIPSPDTAAIQARLAITLGHLFPGSTEFSIDDVMTGLRVMGELPATPSDRPARVRPASWTGGA